MPRKNDNNSPPRDLSDREGLFARLAEYIAWMQARNYSPSTVKRIDRGIGYFVDWCAERGMTRPAQVTRPILEAYARHLYHLRTNTGAPLGVQTQYNELSTLRCFFRFLARKSYILFSPANDLELPRLGSHLPRAVLTHVEMEQVLAQPDVTTDLGVRDRAILETLYSTGVRRAELVRLSIFDIDVARGTLAVRQDKGKKDRVVPIGERALDWIERYINDVRRTLVVDPNEHTLFVTAYGQPMSADALSYRVTGYVDAANIGKKGSCHLFRHTMATLMLERGADVRIIQDMLGHSDLGATQIYTHVSIAHLKEVHAETHPAAKRGRADDPAETEASTAELEPDGARAPDGEAPTIEAAAEHENASPPSDSLR